MKPMQYTRYLFALGAVLFLAACGGQADNNASGTAADAAAVKTYSVAVDAAYAPFEYQDDQGNIIGFSVDLMKAIAEDQNIRFTFTNTPYEGIFARLGTGERDVVLASATITEERQKTMDFSDPYFQATQMIVMAEKGKDIQSFADLQDKLVSVQTGTTGDLAMQKLQGKTSDKIKRMESMPLALNELMAGGVDASVGDNGVIQYFVANHPQANFRTLIDESFEREEYGFVVKKGRNDELLPKINAGLKNIRANGRYETIRTTWFGADNTAGQ
ncbi:MAG: basic amino acid ABC transporter substrate-binding protein [Neisseria sp.]|nr:basic amino acid ABC transporter substrate-binding protein [Neisseria sp.]